ncbi:hypothetical protein K491DRAFT_783651 [Lophiostoma macrostomum CBS 122681]|uniref:Uncharacterized protein n=1 Tax=Lophiostoma macrostomum CBS 122681 TaxID=1314788 RepID=A0A6A6SMD7_9PLEO|nr:hypothetical protein K491DRAFT_783651 [Lophiostoma macrostomum CBS 122681]
MARRVRGRGFRDLIPPVATRSFEPRDFAKWNGREPKRVDIQGALESVNAYLKREADLRDWIRECLLKIDESSNDAEKAKFRSQIGAFYLSLPSVKCDTSVRIAAYAAHDCLNLCQGMLKRLPWDIVYVVAEQLCCSRDVISLDSYLSSSKKSLDDAHYFNPSYVGQDLAKIIAGVYWRKNRFTTHSPTWLSIHLSLQFSRTHVTPLQYLRNLAVEVDIKRSSYASIYNRQQKDQIEEDLKVLLKMRHSKGFELRLVITASTQHDLEDYLKNMTTLYGRFKKAGMLVQVDCRNYKKLAYVKSLIDFFGCSLDEWRAIVEAHRAASRVVEPKSTSTPTVQAVEMVDMTAD